MRKKLNDLGKRKWVLHYTMFFIVVILIFVLFSIKKHNHQMERQQKEQRQHIDQLEQYIHNVTKETDNKIPVIKNHRFIDIYNIPIRV